MEGRAIAGEGGTETDTGPPLVVRSIDDFRHNCYLMESGLQADFADPLPDLTKLMTWVEWINGGNGTPEHCDHFYG
jgi:hypothetical protein